MKFNVGDMAIFSKCPLGACACTPSPTNTIPCGTPVEILKYDLGSEIWPYHIKWLGHFASSCPVQMLYPLGATPPSRPGVFKAIEVDLE